MFKVVIEDKEEWNDYWNLKKSKYFSYISTQQKLHDCYQNYNTDIQKLRKQISKSPKCKAIPKRNYIQYTATGSFSIKNESIFLY